MLRNTVSLGIAFIVMLLISPKGIEILHRLKFGQEVRDDGPEAHLKKQGTPTMGGILFLIAITIGVLPFIGENKGLLPESGKTPVGRLQSEAENGCTGGDFPSLHRVLVFFQRS